MEKLLQFLAGIVSAHEGFAHEKGLVAEGVQLANLAAAGDSTLRHAQHVVGDERAHLHDRVQAYLKGAQIAGVDADDFSSGIERSEERRVGKECRSRWSPYH